MIAVSRLVLIEGEALRKDGFDPYKEGGDGLTRDEQILIDRSSIIPLETVIHTLALL